MRPPSEHRRVFIGALRKASASYASNAASDGGVPSNANGCRNCLRHSRLRSTSLRAASAQTSAHRSQMVVIFGLFIDRHGGLRKTQDIEGASFNGGAAPTWRSAPNQPCNPVVHAFARGLTQLAVKVSAERNDRRRVDEMLSHLRRQSLRSASTWLVIVGGNDEPS